MHLSDSLQKQLQKDIIILNLLKLISGSVLTFSDNSSDTDLMTDDGGTKDLLGIYRQLKGWCKMGTTCQIFFKH